jgi:hypothetical protein
LKKIGKNTPEYLSGLTTHWDLGIFFALGIVLFVFPVALVLPHKPIEIEVWVDVVLAVLFFVDAWRARSHYADELKGSRNKVFQILSIVPFQTIALSFGFSAVWLPLLQGFKILRAPIIYARLKKRSK